MLTHTQIWKAVDQLAERYGLTPSGLAKRAGLDATTFNRSKRTTADGRQRWPSTESIAKILSATGASLDEFMTLLEVQRGSGRSIPYIGLAKAGSNGVFDESGLPVKGKWEEVVFPNIVDEDAYALEVNGDVMLPLYRDGDIIVVSPAAPTRRGDRVLIRLRGGNVIAGSLKRRTARTIELQSLDTTREDTVLADREIAWIARILWASQ